MIDTQVRTGRLLRLRRSMYPVVECWPSDPEGQHLLRAPAEQVAHPGAVLSHGTAAVAWSLPSPSPVSWSDGLIELTRTSESRSRRRAAVAHHLGPLPPHHLTRDSRGYDVTTPAPTAVDAADGLELPQALVVLDAAARLLCAAMVSGVTRATYRNPRIVAAARDQIAEAARTRGFARLNEAIAVLNPSRESAIESLSAGRNIGEADGKVKYTSTEASVMEKRREQYLRDLGCDFVRWLGQEIMFTPRTATDRISHKLELA